jgi:hypothetical protein
LECLKRREELQLAGVEGLLQILQEQSAEQRESTFTGKKKLGRQEIHRAPLGEIPPPGTTQCR